MSFKDSHLSFRKMNFILSCIFLHFQTTLVQNIEGFWMFYEMISIKIRTNWGWWPPCRLRSLAPDCQLKFLEQTKSLSWMHLVTHRHCSSHRFLMWSGLLWFLFDWLLLSWRNVLLSYNHRTLSCFQKLCRIYEEGHAWPKQGKCTFLVR